MNSMNTTHSVSIAFGDSCDRDAVGAVTAAAGGEKSDGEGENEEDVIEDGDEDNEKEEEDNKEGEEDDDEDAVLSWTFFQYNFARCFALC